MTLTRASAYDIAQEARHLIEDIGVERLRINPVGGDSSVRLNESELAEAIQILLPLRKDHPEAGRGSGVFKYLKTLRNPFAATDGNPCPNCEAMLGLRCSVLSDGSAIPCMDAENAVIGNVFTSRFADMWHGGKWMELRRMVHKPRELPHEECAHCEYAGNCRQNCLSAAALCSERICYRRLEEKLSSRRCAASTEQGHGPLFGYASRSKALKHAARRAQNKGMAPFRIREP